SKEFLDAVGGSEGDLIGLPVSTAFDRLGLDPSGDIAALLSRRDTWSGRTVLWPVAGAGLRVPVDLAALPVYDRNRAFEGFRGFGVARFGEAVADEQPDTSGEIAAPSQETPAVT